MPRPAYSYIRMSSGKQIRGDSRRRQLEASIKYAAQNDLELIDNIDGTKLEDLGVSAYKGEHIEKGALGIFLKAIENNKIQKNSVLIIESLDRLSRDKLTESMPNFLNIINRGIEIVTLSDNQRYTSEIINNNPTSLIISLTVMIRANEESETKSKRSKAAWDTKRKNAIYKLVTKRSPYWIKYSESDKKFILIEDRAEIVRKIFNMAISEGGLYVISKYLDEQNVPTFGKAKNWNRSYISYMLRNRAVLGEYQPHIIENGKSIPTEEPIKNYYPAVVTEDIFFQAQSAIERRYAKHRGRKGKDFVNLFQGLIFCGKCGDKMNFRTQVVSGITYKKFNCNKRDDNGGCNMEGWNADTFQKILLSHLKEVDFSSLIANKVGDKEDLMNRRDATEQKINERKKKQENLLNWLEEIDNFGNKEIKERYKENSRLLEMDKALLQELEKKLIELNSQEDEKIANQLNELLKMIDEKKGDRIFRSRVNQYMSRVIDRIELIEGPLKILPWEFDEESESVRKFRSLNSYNSKKDLEKLLGSESFRKFHRDYYREVCIKYKSGERRIIFYGKNTSLNTVSEKMGRFMKKGEILRDSELAENIFPANSNNSAILINQN